MENTTIPGLFINHDQRKEKRLVYALNFALITFEERNFYCPQ